MRQRRQRFRSSTLPPRGREERGLLRSQWLPRAAGRTGGRCDGQAGPRRGDRRACLGGFGADDGRDVSVRSVRLRAASSRPSRPTGAPSFPWSPAPAVEGPPPPLPAEAGEGEPPGASSTEQGRVAGSPGRSCYRSNTPLGNNRARLDLTEPSA